MVFTTTTTPAPRPPRPPRRLRPPSPPHQLVALAALDLPDGTERTFLRSLPAVGDRMRMIELLREVDRLAPDLGVTEAERIAGKRFGLSERQARRYRTGR